jgi:hypothetical protein
MLVRVLFTLAVLCLAGAVLADEKSDRERKAKVALALAGGKSTAHIAPAPRPAAKSYPDAVEAAAIEQRPVVVFVGTEVWWPVDGAIACKTDRPSFGAVKAPAVVVGYTVGDRLLIDATLPGNVSPEAIEKAVRAAARKVDVLPAQPMPAPKPLKWTF